MSETAIEVADVSVAFETPAGPVHALREVSFRCQRGSSVAVIGRSGSGKSTLMSVLSLLRRPTSGTVRVGGVDASTLSDRETARVRAEQVGVIFQSFHLEPALSARENVTLPWRFAPGMAGMPRRAAAARADDLLADLGIADLRHRPVAAMSGGQRQRVAIARALMAQPAVIVADEPTGNLDEETADAVARVLFDLPQQHNSAVVVVTHDPEIARRADRTVELTHGVASEVAS